ncbi:IS982 family transposase, partial [Corynebacterium sp. TAE3-ERU30]|uniref:IS982 family transposase n=1 Tax=Corynebacterium sp. TAE3-ERU30 TaxID=2849496 RepID=UPI001C496157
LISLNLTAEYMSIDSENDLFRKLPTFLSSKIERSVYNKRKRKLAEYIEQVRAKLASNFNEFEDYFIVDSMPLEVCKTIRSVRSKICKETYYAFPDMGYCASQKTKFYGYKLHAVCSIKGVFHSFDLTPASVHDIHYLKDIKQQMRDCTIIADKGYLSSEIQLNLFETCHIKLNVPMRKNQKNYRKQPFVFRKSRKRIETLFSQLCDQFMIRRNYAKSFEGFKTRIISKITALTLIQYINQKIFNRNINNIKVKII